MQGVLSIQSQVVYGHVGNAMATFALNRLGHEVWPVPTVLYSNHPGHGGMTGAVQPGAALTALIDGLDARAMLAGTRAVLSGYLGAADHADVVIHALDRIAQAAPGTPYCCDPVMGDDGKGIYVKSGIPEAIRDRLVPRAAILKPNAFELGWLTGRTIAGPDDAVAAARSLPVPLVVCSSVPVPPDNKTIGAMAITADAAWLVTAPRLEHPPPGTGDLFTALFLGRTLNGADAPTALSAATTSLMRLLAHSAPDDQDIALIDHQEDLTIGSGACLPVQAHKG